MNRLLPLLCLTTFAALHTGCVAEPRREEKGLMASAQRVLALDFGRRATGPRVRRLQRAPGFLVGELRRAETSFDLTGKSSLSSAARNELLRAKTIESRGAQLLGSEAKRRPHLFEGALPTSYEFAENTANDLDLLTRLLGPGDRPLNEIDDLTHRTDHEDKRPVKTLWQRLRRRLPFW